MKITAITQFKVIQSHPFWYQSKAHMICDFLLVINTNLPPILHHFPDIAFDRSKIAIFGYPCSGPVVFNSPDGGVPLGRYPSNFSWMSIVNGWPGY